MENALACAHRSLQAIIYLCECRSLYLTQCMDFNLEIPAGSERIYEGSGRKAGLSYVYFAFHLPRLSPRRRTMSFPYTPNLQDAKIESLERQYEYLNILRRRHLQWMTSTDGPETQRVHREIAERIEHITDQYSRLLDALHQQRDMPPPP